MALKKRVWRIIMENKGRYLGVLSLIFLGSFFFVLVSGIAANLDNLISNFASQNLQEDVSFSAVTPLQDIAAIERESGTLIDSYSFVDASFGENALLQLISPSTRVNIPAVIDGIDGRGLASPGDILVDPNFLQIHGLSIGDNVNIDGHGFTIVGTMALPHYVYPLRFVHDVLPPSGFGIGLISDADFALFPNATSVYSARFVDRENIPTQTMRLNRLLNESGYSLTGWVDAENNRRIQMPWAQITAARAISLPMSSVMFLITCLIVGVMIWRMVKADGVIIGMMYAQGYRRGELIRHYLALPLALAVTGGLLGVLLALPVITPSVLTMMEFYNVPVTGISFSVGHILVGVLLPVAFLGLASYVVVRGELKKTAGELMKGDSGKTKVNFLERSVRLERFTFTTKFQLREQMRSIPRLLFLLLGVTAASFLMLVGFTINNSMNVVLGGGMDDMFNFTIEYSFNSIQHGEAPEGSEPFNAISVFPEGRESAQFYIMGILPDSNAILPRDSSGNVLARNQVIMTFPLANRLRLSPGDSVTVINRMNGVSHSLTVDAIAQTHSGQFIFMPLNDFNNMTGAAEGSYSGLLAERELDIDPQLLAGLMDLSEAADTMDEFSEMLTTMVVVITVIAGLMAIVIIFLVTSLMIEESRGSISLLKVFGYRNKEVAKLILSSSTWVVVAGFALGLPITLLLANAMFRFLGEMINLVLPMFINPLYVAICFVAIMGVYLLTRKLCSRKLNGISMSEALKAGAE